MTGTSYELTEGHYANQCKEERFTFNLCAYPIVLDAVSRRICVSYHKSGCFA